MYAKRIRHRISSPYFNRSTAVTTAGVVSQRRRRNSTSRPDARAAAGTRKPVVDGPRLRGPGDDQARKRIVEGKTMRSDDRPRVLLVAAAPAADPPRALRARRAELLDDNTRRHASVTRGSLP